jgi:hypothetical protein
MVYDCHVLKLVKHNDHWLRDTSHSKSYLLSETKVHKQSDLNSPELSNTHCKQCLQVSTNGIDVEMNPIFE